MTQRFSPNREYVPQAIVCLKNVSPDSFSTVAELAEWMAYSEFAVDWVLIAADGTKLFVPFYSPALDAFEVVSFVSCGRMTFVQLRNIFVLGTSYSVAYDKFSHLLEY